MITGICIYNIFTRALTGQLVFIDNTAAVRRRNQICSSFLPMHLCIYAWNGIVLVYCSSSTNRIFFSFPCYGVLLCFTKCLFGLVWTMPCHQSPYTHTHMCACFFFPFSSGEGVRAHTHTSAKYTRIQSHHTNDIDDDDDVDDAYTRLTYDVAQCLPFISTWTLNETHISRVPLCIYAHINAHNPLGCALSCWEFKNEKKMKNKITIVCSLSQWVTYGI